MKPNYVRVPHCRGFAWRLRIFALFSNNMFVHGWTLFWHTLEQPNFRNQKSLGNSPKHRYITYEPAVLGMDPSGSKKVRASSTRIKQDSE